MINPAVIFATIARQLPAYPPTKAVAPILTQYAHQSAQNACSICGKPLKPAQVHIPGGFECRGIR